MKMAGRTEIDILGNVQYRIPSWSLSDGAETRCKVSSVVAAESSWSQRLISYLSIESLCSVISNV